MIEFYKCQAHRGDTDYLFDCVTLAIVDMYDLISISLHVVIVNNKFISNPFQLNPGPSIIIHVTDLSSNYYLSLLLGLDHIIKGNAKEVTI